MLRTRTNFSTSCFVCQLAFDSWTLSPENGVMDSSTLGIRLWTLPQNTKHDGVTG